MKKILISVVTLIAINFINAQNKTENIGGYREGDLFITGSVNFSSKDNPENDVATESLFSIAPKFGFFVSPNVVLGAGFGISTLKSTRGNGLYSNFDSQNKYQLETTSIAAFGRLYGSPSSRFSIFGQMSLEYSSLDNGVDKINGFGFEIAPGASYFLNKHFAFELLWGALRYTEIDAGFSTPSAIEFGLNLDAVKLGLVYKF